MHDLTTELVIEMYMIQDNLGFIQIYYQKEECFESVIFLISEHCSELKVLVKKHFRETDRERNHVDITLSKYYQTSSTLECFA